MTRVWDIGFPGSGADEQRACQLALLRLMEPVADGDPCGHDTVALLRRDLRLSVHKAQAVVARLERAGWIGKPPGPSSYVVAGGVERPSYEEASWREADR